MILGNRVRALTGLVDLKLNGTIEDPLEGIKVGDVISGFYLEFDMELHLDRVVREWILKP